MALTEKQCSVEECQVNSHARGLCRSHYMRWWRYGDVNASDRRRLRSVCSFRDCGYPVKYRGLCNSHAEQQRRGLELRAVKRTPRVVSAERFCTMPLCEKRLFAAGLCGMHYQRQRKHGDPDVQRQRKQRRRCCIPACGRQVLARSFCQFHYDRWYQRTNPDVGQRANRIRKQRMKANGVFKINERDIRRLLARYNERCAYCGDNASEVDHVVPLARGGRHAIGNLLPCCQHCNRTKLSRLLVEWRRAGGMSHAQ